jgi:hypothetical protein
LAFGFPADYTVLGGLFLGAKELTELLKKSLLVYAAVPATNLPDFARLAGTPLTVKGSGSTIASVSVTPSISIEIAEGGAMIECESEIKVTGKRNLDL